MVEVFSVPGTYLVIFLLSKKYKQIGVKMFSSARPASPNSFGRAGFAYKICYSVFYTLGKPTLISESDFFSSSRGWLSQSVSGASNARVMVDGSSSPIDFPKKYFR